MKIIYTLLAVCVFAGSDPGQSDNRPNKSTYVVAPTENTLVTVAAQNQCPLRIENPQLLLNTNIKWDFRFHYQVRNIGSKTIKSYRIVFITSDGTGGTINDERLRDRRLRAREVASDPFSIDRVVPLTESLMSELKLGSPMKIVVFLLVEQVEFVDGQIYTDVTSSSALKRYFLDLTGAR